MTRKTPRAELIAEFHVSLPQLALAAVAEAAFGFQEVLVAQGRVFGADVRVAGGDEVLAVQPGLGLDLPSVDA